MIAIHTDSIYTIGTAVICWSLSRREKPHNSGESTAPAYVTTGYSLHNCLKNSEAAPEKVAAFLRSEDKMYASKTPLRAPQPSKYEVRALAQEQQRIHEHPPSQEALRSLWHPEERARKAVLS